MKTLIYAAYSPACDIYSPAYQPEPRFDITLGDYSRDLCEVMSTEDQDAREADEAAQVAYIQEWARS